MKGVAIVLAAVTALAAGCGGGGGGPAATGRLVGKLSRVGVSLSGGTVVATARVSEGGVAGRRLTLKWGLVDAVAGRASQEERVAARYTTTRTVVTRDETVRFRRPLVPGDYLIHFVLYKPDGSWLDSADTDEFNIGP